MTVPTTVRSITHPGDGSATQFSYPFKILDEDHLIVTLIASGGGETIQSITTNYSVAGVGVPAGGLVTMVIAPAIGESLRIERTPPIVQLLDLRNQGTFVPENLEDEYDWIIMILQALAEGAITASNVDENAIHDNVAGEIDAIAAKATPVDADVVVIEDSEDGFSKKKVTLDNLISGEPKMVTYTDSPETRPAAVAANDGLVYKVRAADGFERIEYIFQESGGGTYERGVIHHATS